MLSDPIVIDEGDIAICAGKGRKYPSRALVSLVAAFYLHAVMYQHREKTNRRRFAKILSIVSYIPIITIETDSSVFTGVFTIPVNIKS